MFLEVSIPQSLRALIGSGLDDNRSRSKVRALTRETAAAVPSRVNSKTEALIGLSDAELARQGLSRGLLALRHGDPETR